MTIQSARLQFHPVTPDRWRDFEKLFGQNGVTAQLLEAAVQFARKHGAHIIEGYPVDSGGEKKNATSVFTGLASTFQRAGFVEVARRTPMRPIMRYFVV